MLTLLSVLLVSLWFYLSVWRGKGMVICWLGLCVTPTPFSVTFPSSLPFLFPRPLSVRRPSLIKIFVLWIHGHLHIEQIDLTLLNRTQAGMTYQLVIWYRCGVNINIQPYFSSNIKSLFEIYITVKSNMIGRSMVAMETNSKHDGCYVTTYLIFVPSMTSMGCLTSKLERFQY